MARKDLKVITEKCLAP